MKVWWSGWVDVREVEVVTVCVAAAAASAQCLCGRCCLCSACWTAVEVLGGRVGGWAGGWDPTDFTNIASDP